MARLKNTAEFVEASGIPHRKDTVRWCKGRVGIQHRWGSWYKLFPDIPRSTLEESRCGECGKKRLR